MNAPNKSAKINTTEANDADLHANNLTNWQQEYDQTSRGKFHGSIVELEFNDLQVFRESTNQALQQQCKVRPNSIWLGIPLAKQTESRINGLNIHADTIMCRPSDYEFELTTPKSYSLYGIAVEQSTLINMASIHGIKLNWQTLSEHGRFTLPKSTLEKARFLLARLLSPTHQIPQEQQEPSSRLQHDIVMMTLLEILKTETPQPPETPSYRHRKHVVDCVRKFVNTNQDAAITVTQLCTIANVSRRTLQYSFESILGISPIQYLRISRLNGSRRSLVQTALQQDKNEYKSSVSDIAEQWGFWHLSQFAKDYKQLFGECPSQTLKVRSA